RTLADALTHVIDHWSTHDRARLATIIDNHTTERTPHPRVLLVRMTPQTILITGTPTLATKVNKTILTDWAPWRPHPGPRKRTPLPNPDVTLDSRTYNALRRIGIDTTEETATIPTHLLHNVRSIGPGITNTIQKFLS
ncbi:MAG: hypothetical protein M3443_07890, partial [Actinomycetota bacterium]|nr:hypothetical protein [Actinomycetota bacterium]